MKVWMLDGTAMQSLLVVIINDCYMHVAVHCFSQYTRAAQFVAADYICDDSYIV